MTTNDWLCGHLKTRYTKNGRSCERVHGLVSRPTYYSGVGYRDRVMKSPQRFDYRVWGNLVFNAEISEVCHNKMRERFVFYPCYASNLTRDRLNAVARALNIPIAFHLDDDGIYCDDMRCDYIYVYPGLHEIIYHVHGVNMENYDRDDYLVIKMYDKKGVRWV